MGDVKSFIRRLNGGSGVKKVAWSDQDVARWREIYGVTEKEAAQAIKEAAQTPAQQFKVRVNKFATDSEFPLKWSFTASDGKVDRDHDIVSVAGIRLDEFAKNPLWHWQHNYRQPIGVSPKTYRENGKLKSVLELGIGIYEPDASMVQKGLASGQIRACSIGFMPLRWDFNKSRDGVDFHEIMLTEISACSLPACPGTILDGPVKSLQQQAADYRAQVAAYKANLKRKFETRKAELAAEWRMRHGQ
jgi:HK97 family phage prohead protease